ncbi:MAG: threonine-phosphate decarboxylase [Anaerolineales bacterium]|nr:threonine-phosphate decarboxylase [Anaerolineales bacterium]
MDVRAPRGPEEHGGIDSAELEALGLRPESIIDFSSNVNPFGPFPGVREALETVRLDRYPDRESHALRRALAARIGVPPDQILAGNGAAELIGLAASAFLRPGDEVLILAPTFSEYERASRRMGARPRFWTASAEDGFRLDPSLLAKKNAATEYRAVFLCNPNNPTGQLLAAEVIAAWAEAHPETLYVVDESYLAFVPGIESVLRHPHRNVLALRSMTKDYALAGLRLGYAVGAEETVRAMAAVRPPWNVNAFAQAAGLAALEEEQFLRRTLERLQVEKNNLLAGLEGLGFAPVPSRTHFFLLPVGDSAAFRARLLPRGIAVRNCASFGLPENARLATRTGEENARLLAALAGMPRDEG